MNSERYPVLIRAMCGLQPATPEEIEHLATRIAHELGTGAPQLRTLGEGGIPARSIALAAAAVGMDRRGPAFRRLRRRIKGTLHLAGTR